MKVTVEDFVPVEWRDNNLYFFGLESIIFWKSPSLKSLLDPFVREFGRELYWLLIAFEATKGTHEDYHAMVEEMGDNFEEGFNNWGKAVKNAGWGNIYITHLCDKKLEATVTVEEPWEIKIDRPEDYQYWCPFLCGKFSGIFSSAFQKTTRARVTNCEENDGKNVVTFSISPAQVTIEQEAAQWMKKTDISDQNKQQALNIAVQEQNKRFHDVVNSVGEFIWEAGKGLDLTFLTDKLGELLSIPSEKLLQKKMTDFLDSSYRDQFIKNVEELKDPANKELIKEMQVQLSKEYEGRWLNLRWKGIYDITGNFYGLRGAGRDITKEVQLESELEEQRKMATHSAKMAALGEMSSGVAHEINNPLTILTGQIDLLNIMRTKGTLSDEKLGNSLEKMRETVDRMAVIIKGLRKFSRNDAKVERELVPVKDLFEEVENFSGKRLKDAHIELKYHLDPEDIKVSCNSVQISQILLNLVNNAFDSLKNFKGERWVELRAVSKEDRIEICVLDSGPGIPLENREKIMNPFFTTKEVGEGTGLGLSISLGIAHDHGGELYYEENSPDCCFVLSLPKDH